MTRRLKRQPKEQYELDIVIPVYGRPDLLRKCLDSIEATKGDIKARLILVDDKGPEPEALKEVYRSLNGNSHVAYNRQNSGFARTVNTGVGLGNAPLVLVLNTDIELQPGALQAMIAEFDDPQVGVVGAKLLFPADSYDPTRPAGKVQHAGLAVNWRGNIVHANIGWSADHPAVNERRVLQAVTGAMIMLRRETWRKVVSAYRQAGDPTSGAFNDVYGKGCYEDVEFCFAARSVGYQVIYTPGAVAYHHVGGSIIAANESYPLGRNEMIFRARCGHFLAWDEYRFS